MLCAEEMHSVEKILDNCRRICGAWPKPATSPLVNGDHPELDASELLNEDHQKMYQSLIGALQWVIQIGRFDIQTSVMISHASALCRDKDTLTASKESMGVFLRCAMLQSRSGLTHLIVRKSQSSCATGNAPATLMQRKKFLWTLLHQKGSRQL